MQKAFAKSLSLLLVILFTISGFSPVTPIAHAQTETKSLELTPCQITVGIGGAAHGIDVKCGVLKVPQDWTKPDGKKLDIHVTVVPATSASPKGLPIFHLEGGPGGSARSAFGRGWYIAYQALRQDHDIVLIDQRGTGQSASLQCTEISEQALSDLADTQAQEDQQTVYLDRIANCLERVSATYDPTHFTSAILAKDTDAVRAALGYKQIDLYGSSYGTELAQFYMRDFGANIHAVVLDGAVAPWNNPLVVAPGNIEQSLNLLFSICQSDPACNKAYPDLPGQLKTALDKLSDKPITVNANSLETNDAYPVAMTRRKFLYTLSEMLTSGSLIVFVPMAISQAAQGGYIIPAGVEITLAEHSNDVSTGLYYSVTCAEQVAFFNEELLKQYDNKGTFSSVYDTPDLLTKSCNAWRSAELAASDVAPIKSDIPTLILVGGFDPITPVSFAQETNKRLSKSQLVVLPYQSHGVIIGSKCAQNLFAQFLLAPTTPVDISCADSDLLPVFAGAYEVKFVGYSDPKGTFSTVIPEGWQVQQGLTNTNLTFFASPDNTQFIGVGVLRGTKLSEAKAVALKAIVDNYGAIEVQQEIDVPAILFTIKIVAHAMDRPDQFYVGTLWMRDINGDTYITWQAAPNSVFQAAQLAILPQVFAQLH
jgi:pimeloyl-ACP methyl ester carboxylesterase